MDSETLVKKIGISEELIKKSCSLSWKDQFSKELYHVDKSSSDAVFIVFPGSWTVKEWFSGDQAFGETKINSKDWSKKAFPSMRSIGNDDVAIVNQAFLERFELVLNLKDSKFLEEVKSAESGNKPIIFTGHSSGGAVAVLATIWFLEQSPKEYTGTAKCVTFGSPLVGDYIVSHALKREKWSEHFIHFVMRYDIVPRILLAPRSSIEQQLEHVLHFFTANGDHYPRESIEFYTNVMRNTSALASHAACKLMGNTNLLLETLTNFTKLSPYRPFGTYIFCTGNGKLVHLDNPEAVLQLLFFSCQLSHENEMEATAGSCIKAHLDYKTEVLGRSLKENVVFVDRLEELPLAPDGSALDDLGLSTRGRLCLRAAGELEKQKQKNREQIDRKKAEMEEGMKGLEEYRTFNAQKVGYYDAFKKQNEKRDFDANVRRLVLAGIWDEIIEMLKRYDLPDEFEGEDNWIELGTKFRRLVEPLDIANYYRHAKNEDTGAYMIKGRPRRYRYPQRWLEKKVGLERDTCGESCFWAEVEELLKLASNGGKVDETRAKKLQEGLARWIEQGVAGEEVFLGDSTFLKLWDELGRLKLQQESIRTLIDTGMFANLSVA
ncbi:putative carboxylesterase [Rosa chinensis]|uniref:Putative carboxylesterase n=1 Tax=Rosa chinensis TaxID=74649 RepID=A0A2P6P278_ROSCH|nr:protein EDS1L [Rosa chinensis]PRQ16036.1 putative carboxylesterase [Rosa chinensis]